MSNHFTEKEAAEIGSPVHLLNDWADLMQSLWTESIDFFQVLGYEDLEPRQGDNEIHLGNSYKIDAHIVNDKYIEVEVHKEKQVLAVLRYFGDDAAICMLVFALIRSEHAYNSKTL